MNLKTVLYEINYQSEIVVILKKIEAKIDNIKVLWDELNEYKKELYKEKSNNDSIKQKIENVYKISIFVEDMLINSGGATVRDFETLKKELKGEFKNSREFVNDWKNIEKILKKNSTNSLEQDEILEIPEFSNEELSLINNESETNIQTECFSTKSCTIL